MSRVWPFTSRAAVLLVPTIFVVLLIGWGFGRTPLHLQDVSTGWVLLGIVLLSVLPLMLVVLEGLATTGGTIEVATVKIALTSAAAAQRTPVVPRNVTQEPGLAIPDSGRSQIMEALKSSSGSDIVVVDLEDGHAWWETRLLILCAGAARLGRPRLVVFVANQEGQTGMFVGWAHPSEIRDQLLKADGRYRKAVNEAYGTALATRLIQAPGNPASVTNIVAGDPSQLNTHLEEQHLAYLLNQQIELSGTTDIGSCRLRDMQVLRTSSLEKTESDANWFRAALQQDNDDVASTDRGRYVAIMSRTAVINAVLLALTDQSK